MIEQLALVDSQPVGVDAFEVWWKQYPVKRDKQPARRKFNAQIRKGATLEELCRARDAYLEDCRRSDRFVKYPKTFLGVWDEWLPTTPTKCVTPSTPPNTVKVCGGCGQWDRYCDCGHVLHDPTRKPRSEGSEGALSGVKLGIDRTI